jgi:hypothetical protein
MRNKFGSGTAPLVLRPSERQTLAPVGVCLAFVVLGAFMIVAEGSVWGRAAVEFSGLGAMVLGAPSCLASLSCASTGMASRSGRYSEQADTVGAMSRTFGPFRSRPQAPSELGSISQQTLVLPLPGFLAHSPASKIAFPKAMG